MYIYFLTNRIMSNTTAECIYCITMMSNTIAECIYFLTNRKMSNTTAVCYIYFLTNRKMTNNTIAECIYFITREQKYKHRPCRGCSQQRWFLGISVTSGNTTNITHIFHRIFYKFALDKICKHIVIFIYARAIWSSKMSWFMGTIALEMKKIRQKK